MSLSSAKDRNDYTGLGTLATYVYSFRIFSEDDLTVEVRNTTTGAITTLTITTDYTVSGVGLATGGNVVLVNASQAWLTAGNLSIGYTLAIRRVVDLVQNTDIRNQGTFYPETHEDALDYLTMVDQQQQDAIDRTVKLPGAIPSTTFDPTLPSTITEHPGATLVVNTAGDGFSMSSAYFALYIQATPPTNPAATVLAFWFDQSIDQMKIWCVTEWRIIA